MPIQARTLRLEGCIVLLACTAELELNLHTANGPVLQLLGLVVNPGARASFVEAGNTLRGFMLAQARLDASVRAVCGVTRCREFDAAGTMTYEEHVRSGQDCGLQFHLGGGARVIQVISGYRPADAANCTNGVLIRYETRCNVPLSEPL